MAEYVQQENGNKGEDRTRARIPKGFWIISRDVDSDAADVIVQERYKSAKSAVKGREDAPRLGYIQAKFFERKNQVKIDRMYVENLDGKPRKGFFAFLHTENKEEEHVDYFFTAEEIIEEWNITKDGDYYYFSLTKNRKYEQFKNLKPTQIRAKLAAGISSLNFNVMRSSVQRFLAIYSSVRSDFKKPVEYFFCRPHDSWTVVCKVSDNVPHALETQKEAYLSFGTFQWGYSGEGAKLLSASLLTHFLCGRRPLRSQIDDVVNYLVSRLPPDSETVVTGNQVLNALAKLPFNTSASTTLEATMVDEARKMCENYIASR